jgi:murein L,D-transpeptidase YcbB/YkuD
MPGVRLDRFLASTAIVLLLTGAASSASAEPKSGSNPSAVTSTPTGTATPADSTVTTPAGGSGSGEQAKKPGESSSEPILAEPSKPAASREPSAAPTIKAEEPSEQSTATIPAATAAKPTEQIEQPAAVATEPAEAKPTEANPTEAKPADAKPADAMPAAAAPASQPAEPATVTGGDEVPTPAAAPAKPATDQAATPAPAAVADANAPIADQLRELANGKYDRVLGGKKERVAFEAFYAARNYAPVWMTDGHPNERAKAAIAYLGQVDADGLEPADYPVPSLSSVTDATALADAEMRLTASIVTYAHHAQVGRVHWSRVSGDILYDLKPPTPADVLARMTETKDINQALADYEPHTAGYVALKAKLAELRAGKGAGKTPIANGPAPKLGMDDDRVPELRERLGLQGDGSTYDKPLADAVKKFQQSHELRPTGLLTQQTLDALNGRQPDRPTDIVIANMERWRWMPHDLGKSYVIVNLPDYTLRVFHNGHQAWMTRIVTGKPNMPTPIMSTEMKFITVNPTWNVPPSIVAREYMPALQQDPTVLTRMGLRVSTNPDGTVHISQPPGEANALGRLRFNFPNKFLVYQHDTPNKNLFALDKRALSHGCMRVQDPAKYAEVLLSIVRPGEGYTEERIRRMFGTNESDIQFPKFLPVHLTYQTAFVDDQGKLEFREDMYGRDKALLAILKSDERKVADTAVERRENSVRREALAMPDQPGFFGSRSYGGGGDNFFTRLFGGGDPSPPPGRNRRAAQRRQEIQ